MLITQCAVSISKLLLPNLGSLHLVANSESVPSETKIILTNLGRVDNFSFDRPSFIQERVEITTYGGAKHVLENQDKYKVIWNEGLSFLMGAGGGRFLPSGDTAAHGRQPKFMHDQLLQGNWRSHFKSFFAQITDQLIQEKSYKLAGTNFVDIVRDVGNIAPVHFASRKMSLPWY